MGLLRTETAAVLGGADAEGADERAAHRLGGAVAAGAGGLLDAARRCPRGGGARPRAGRGRRTGRAACRPRRRRRGRTGAGTGWPARRGPRRRGRRRDARRSTAGPRAAARGSATWAESWALNCDWLPGRRRNTTRWRATASATSRPRSSSTRASARSMPAVTPAEVATLPSLMKIGSGSTVTSGYRAASSAQYAQWVVTRLPCSSPAAASRNAPVQTDAIRSRPRRVAGAASAPGPGRRRRAPSPPGTSSRSGALPVSSAQVGVGRMASPLVVRDRRRRRGSRS